MMKGIDAFFESKRVPWVVLKYRKLLYRPDVVYHIHRNGINFVLRRAGMASKELLMRGRFEPEQIAFFFRNAQQRGADIFLDIGANFGYYSLLAAKTGMFSEIHAMEAHPKNHETLLANIAANDFSRVITPHNTAASDADERIFIDSKPHETVQVHKNSRDNVIPISATTLDSVFDFTGRNIAIKIDVEGHEVAALQGMKNLIRRNSVFLQVEIWEHSAFHIHSIIECGLRLHHRIGDDFYFTNDKE